MKETDLRDKDNVENIQEQKDSPQKLQGKIRLKKGHTIFELNRKTGEIKPAEYEPIPASFMHEARKESLKHFGLRGIEANPKTKGKVIIKEHCSYVPALNIQNAVRKLGIKVKLVKTKKKRDGNS